MEMLEDMLGLSNAEVEVNIVKDEEVKPEISKEEYVARCKKEAMEKLGEFESLENKKTILKGEWEKANQELEMLFSKVRAKNLDLVNKIKSLEDELSLTETKQDTVREELLPIQRELYLADDKEKTLIYNKIQSTFVAATEKNQFDLKKFREEQKDFWEEHYGLLKDYAKISDVAAYLKITIKK